MNVTKSDVESLIFITGWQTCCEGFELKSGFSMKDVQCLDSSIFIPAGGSIRYENNTTGGSVASIRF